MMSRTRQVLSSLKTCDKRIVQTETRKVSNVFQYITTSNITDCNNLLYAVALVVSELGKTRRGKGMIKLEKESAILEKKDREQNKEVETGPE